jgi:hypothetical protein
MTLKGTATVELPELLALLMAPETADKRRVIDYRVRVNGRLIDAGKLGALAVGHTLQLDLSRVLLELRGAVDLRIELTPES